MSRPRQVLPDRVLSITQRTHDGRFYLLPDRDEVEQIVLYLVAVAADRFDMSVLAVCGMASHIHVVVHDRHGQHPAFTQWLHAMIARATNQLRGRFGALFDRRQPGVVELADRDVLLEHLCYVAANPTAAGLVEHGRDYPGARTNPQDFVTARTIERPATAFFQDSSLPESVTLRLEVPPGFHDLAPSEFAGRFASRLGEVETELRRAWRAQGRSFLGKQALKRKSWKDTPKSKLQRGRGTIRPRVAATTKAGRVAVLNRLADFVRDHAEALATFRRGDRGVSFPLGTWAAVRRFGARSLVPT